MANGMNFEEKIDAMRVTLELAIHDIEGLRSTMHQMGQNIAGLQDTAHTLLDATQNLIVAVNNHEHRISKLERAS